MRRAEAARLGLRREVTLLLEVTLELRGIDRATQFVNGDTAVQR